MANTSQDSRKQSRRTFVKSAATAATGVAVAAASGDPRVRSANEKKKNAKRKEIKRIYLFMHPPSTLSYRELLKPNPPVEESWRKIVAEKVAIHGTVSAGVIHSRFVALMSGSNVEADIHHSELAIEEGAMFDGCSRRTPEGQQLPTPEEEG